MNRRSFITLLGGAAAAWPLAARAQQLGAMRDRRCLGLATGKARRAYLEAFVPRLHKLGWVDGRKLALGRFAAARGRIPRADKPARRSWSAIGPDVIVDHHGNPAVAPLQQATRSMPDRVHASTPIRSTGVCRQPCARPGGNITGLSPISSRPWAAKWLELLKQDRTASQARRCACIARQSPLRHCP